MNIKDHAIEISDLFVSYNDISVLKGINFNLRKGDVHIILGQNATGKSTLIHTIMGLIEPDQGTIKINGVVRNTSKTRFFNTRDLYTVFQEPKVFPNLSVKENIFFDTQPKLYGPKYFDHIYEEFSEIYNINISGDRHVSDISAGEKKIVELLRAYNNNPEILILDEPSAFFTKIEREFMFKLVRNFKEQGKSILYITHKIEDAVEIGDVTSIIFDGVFTETFSSKSIKHSEILRLVAGKKGKDRYPKIYFQKGRPLLSVSNINNEQLNDINFTLYEKEIVGVTGVVGCGKTSLGKVIAKLQKTITGSIYSHKHQSIISSRSDVLKFGIGYIAEEGLQNLVPDFTGPMNISLSQLDRVSNKIFINTKVETTFGKYFYKKLLIDDNNINLNAKYYSGGDKQKISLARYLFSRIDILIIDEPTKGVDIPSKVDIYNLFNDILSIGKTILLLTSDFSEACGVCDRVFVMNNGKFSGELSNRYLTEENIIRMLTTNNLSK